jgi:hypothetical protein
MHQTFVLIPHGSDWIPFLENAVSVHRRHWTCLYIKDRESNNPHVEVDLDGEEPSTFKVRPGPARLEEWTALYLFLSWGNAIAADGCSFRKPQDHSWGFFLRGPLLSNYLS